MASERLRGGKVGLQDTEKSTERIRAEVGVGVGLWSGSPG